jgi:hypothetical protein
VQSEVDGQRVLKGLLAVTTGLRTMAEVSDELGLPGCHSDDEEDDFPDTDTRLLDNKILGGGGEDRSAQRYGHSLDQPRSSPVPTFLVCSQSADLNY